MLRQRLDDGGQAYSKTLKKGIGLLKLFDAEGIELSGPAIAKLAGMHRTSVYRMLAALVSEGMLERHNARGTYSLGPALYMLGSLYLASTDLLRAAEPVAQLVNELTGEVVNVTIFQRGYVTIILREESRHDFRWSRHVGSVLPAHASATGKAILSTLQDSEIDLLYPNEALLQLTPKTVGTRFELKETLARIRRTGVVVDYEQTSLYLAGIACPIRDSSGGVVAGLGVGVPLFRIDKQRECLIAELVRRAASLISYRLGHADSAAMATETEDLRKYWDAAILKQDRPAEQPPSRT